MMADKMSDAQNSIRKRYMPAARELSRISVSKALLGIAQCWTIIAVALAMPFATAYVTAQSSDPIWTVLNGSAFASIATSLSMLLGGIAVAARQHALLVIMHDATHFRLLPNKHYNEIVANWACAFPIGVVTSLYRRGHLVHHTFTNSAHDPYFVQMKNNPNFVQPIERKRLISIIFRDVVGLNLKEWGDIVWPWLGCMFLIRPRQSNWLTLEERLQFGVFWIMAVTGMIVVGQVPYALVMWLLPSLTWLLVFSRIRILAEHTMTEAPDELARTRHVDAYCWERFLFGPMNINYHIAHHLYPSVPFYNLPEMHRVLMRDQSFAANGLIYRSYLGRRNSIMREILK